MMAITLKNGYYIEIDPLNYTLRQKYKGRPGKGKRRILSEHVVTLGISEALSQNI